MKGTLATRSEAVIALGLVSARQLDRLIERGAPKPAAGKRGGRRYDLEALRSWQTARAARLKPQLDLSTERAKLAKVQRQLTTLKLREARGELIRAADAERVLAGVAAAVKVSVLSVPQRAVLAGLPRGHEALIKRLLVTALQELAEVRTFRAVEARGRGDA